MPVFRCARCLRRPRWPGWRRGLVGRRVGGGRWWPLSGPRWGRCRLPSPGCGLSISCRGLHRFTTWRWRCGWAGGWMPRCWGRRWPMWWAAMRACARCLWRGEGVPQQLVVPVERADFGWHVVDASGWPAGRLQEAIGAAARRPFDLAAEIPLRARLFRVAEDEHVLVAVVHHIAADGSPIPPLVRDLGAADASRGAGRAPGGADLAVQYADYTLWQRAQLGDLADGGSRIAAQLRYWEQALAGIPERLMLPTDRPYPPVADYHGATVAVDWPAELQQRVARMAHEHNATSFMVIQAALAVLLSNLSASSDVAVGFPIAGRRDPALDELVGFFVNTLVLRVEVAGDPTFTELLAQVQQRSLAAYEHQDVPFEVLVERLNPTRSLAHHPLVQVMLAWQNLPWQDNDPAAGLGLGDVQVT